MSSPLLIAASPGGARELTAAFDRHADYSVAQSFEEALELLKQGQFAAIVVGYYFDQAQLYSEQKFKPAWFTLKEIKAHTERLDLDREIADHQDQSSSSGTTSSRLPSSS